MAKLTIEQTHAHSPEEAKKRLQALSDQLSSKYGIESRWTSDREAEIKRSGVSGKITCSDGKVTVFLDLSFALTPLKGTIEDRVRQELKKTLA